MRALMGFLSLFTEGEHIGVITPYHAQRCKILDLLYRDPKFRDIKVGSVEEFQGQVCFFRFPNLLLSDYLLMMFLL
jgi:helicase MOV-10